MLKIIFKKGLLLLVLFYTTNQFAQHQCKMTVAIDTGNKIVTVFEELTFKNESQDTLSSIVFNDWNHSYSSKNSLLATRFSDEFIRTFHLSNEKERGYTNLAVVTDSEKTVLKWLRPKDHLDLIVLELNSKLAPNKKIKLFLTYTVKIPSAVFTKYGYDKNGDMNLKNWYLAPARFENHSFVTNSNANIDDCANGLSDYDLEIQIPKNFDLESDLDEIKKTANDTGTNYFFSGKKRMDFSLFLEKKTSFLNYKNDAITVLTNLEGNLLSETKKTEIIAKIVGFVGESIGKYPYNKISVSQVDYDRNPFYGLNQLPSFISPFSDEFEFEIKFLKTYLTSYLKTSLNLNARKDNWIFDGIQMFTMMKYIEKFHPESKMMGRLFQFKLLKEFNLVSLNFNEQYSYYSLLMARKNLDQPLSESKDNLIKFNEKIASKYKAGLSFQYLDAYLQQEIVPKTIQEFYILNTQVQTSRLLFEKLLKSNSNKNIDWFIDKIIDSRALIDYKITSFSKTNEQVTLTIKNKLGTAVPIPIYGLKKGSIVFKKWLNGFALDSTFTIERYNADKIVLNYKNEVPEYNLRNNWKNLNPYSLTNRPIKFTLMKDLENPNYNQILFVPTLTYNLYDGLTPGLRFHNKTILDKPISFDINPMYAPISQSVTGNYSLGVNQNFRTGSLYNARYYFNGSYFHYAPNAAYLKLNPTVILYIREPNFRDNRKQALAFRYNVVKKEMATTTTDATENYTIFSAKYFNSKTEITNHFNFNSDTQLSQHFGKLTGEIQYRKLLNNNRQMNARAFAGAFIYNNNSSNYYNFGVSKINDYLFDYDLIGRSESTGLLSQQFIQAEGGFKSKLDVFGANKWLVTTNASISIWNWVEFYGDLGIIKNENSSEKLLFDNGIRLNFVTDYFEVYFPIYSNNGWEMTQHQYTEKIRFVITLSPNTLLTLFTRKWF